MTRYVVDASAAVEYLLQTTLGLKIADLIEGIAINQPTFPQAITFLGVMRTIELAG